MIPSLLRRRIWQAAALCIIGVSPLAAADWPTWRYDAQRSAASPEELPAELHLMWWRQHEPTHVAWPEDERLQFDTAHEPVVLGKTMFVVSSRNDSVTAIDTETGRERWRFFAEGPVRLAPIAHQGKVYFGADDGYFYCLDASQGSLQWKLRAAPGPRRAIGNERLISVWPIRGGPVLIDNKIYFTAGIWPFEGTLLYTIDVGGDSEGVPDYKVTTLDYVSPQGHLAATERHVFIPCGRDRVTCIDRTTGKTVPLNYDSRGRMDYHVATAGSLLLHGDRMFDLATRRMLPFEAHRPAVTSDWIFASIRPIESDRRGPGVESSLVALRIEGSDAEENTEKKYDRRGNPIQATRMTQAWKVPATQVVVGSEDPAMVDIVAGDRVYGHQGSTVFAFDVAEAGERPRLSWKARVEGTPASMLAADGKLFVVTREGSIGCFGGEAEGARMYPARHRPLAAKSDEWENKAAAILAQTGTNEGYCLVPGIGTGRLVEELARQSNLRIVAVDADAGKVDALRRKMDAAGLYGMRVTALVADPLTCELPPYFASLIATEGAAAGLNQRPALTAKLWKSLRPYGGTMCMTMSDEEHENFQNSVAESKLDGAELKQEGDATRLTRAGPPAGAADWTHEYGDAANSLMSQDQAVKAPLGVLWFGGPAGRSELFFDRHEWPPGMLAVEGRMFLQGPGRLAAVDMYTGRMLWSIPLRGGGGSGRRGNFFDRSRPGFHFVAVKDALYLVYDDHCQRIDPATGKKLSELRLPGRGDRWGKVRVWQDLLITTAFRQGENRSQVPSEIVAFDRTKGNVAWTHKPDFSCPMVAVGGDKVFYFDGILHDLHDAWKRRGLIPEAEPQRLIKALDARTGEPLWERSSERIVTWLGYSPDHNVLVASNKKGIEAIDGADGRELWSKQQEGLGFGGHPENLWDKVILANDQIIDQRGPGLAYDMKTGKRILQRHPISGDSVPWEFTKTGHHCNYAIASPNLVTFRAGAAGYVDRDSCTTARLVGFRSGCRNSLIPAGGVLNAPNYAYGCACGYSIFTSLALVHVPHAEQWGYSAHKPPAGNLQRLGVNLGALGDRQATDGTLWLNFPGVNGPSPDVPVSMTPEQPEWFRHPSIRTQGESLPWVGASGAEGLDSMVINLPGNEGEKTYTVRLYFAEPQSLEAGQRVFSVALQDETVEQALDVVREAGAPNRLIVKEFPGVAATGELKLKLTPSVGKSLLCGVEIIAEKPQP